VSADLKIVASNDRPVGGAAPLSGPVLSLSVAESRARIWEALKRPDRARAVRERAERGE
jgi:hypothetical protein